MFAWTPKATPHVALGEPSPLLSHIAGEFASQIAGLWPAPHAVFLTTEAPRRHLLCLCLAQAGVEDFDAAIEAIMHGGLKAAIAVAVAAPPAGLKRALEQMGETAWTRTDYLRLLDLLAHPTAAKVLRHATGIEPAQVCAMAALPRPLLDAGLGGLGLSLHQARLVGEVHAALEARDGAEAVAALERRWANAASARDMVGLIEDDLMPELPQPVFLGTSRLRPLATRAALRDAGARYRNCLRHQVKWAATGTSCYFEWLGQPRAIVEVTRDKLFGWRLDQARLEDNVSVPEPTRTAICAELHAMGVHVGRSEWDVMDALENSTQARFELDPVEVPVAGYFTA
jgi:hypothetical protein